MPTDFTLDDTSRLAETLRQAVDGRVTPGGVIVCGTRDGERHVITAGTIGEEASGAPATEHTLYDIASLTKVVSTWPLAGQQLDAGLLKLDAPVRDFLPVFSGEAPSGQATIRQLLSHTSGLRAATRLDHYRGAEAPLHELLCREPLEDEPGTHRYINRGYILLGLAIAHMAGLPLEALADDLWGQIGMTSTCYGPVARRPDVAPTEQRIPGAPRIWGSVHDENAALLGGIAGHAGVFATPFDLARYAEQLLAAYSDGQSELGGWLRASLIGQVTIEPGVQRGLAWILADDSRLAYHHGWTGTSLYLAPHDGRYVVICTNAVYYGYGRGRLAPLRDLALKTLSAA
ncbi:serine hydrolase domain-containing protein [Microtetraspora fusca]|uniref:Serine hydrolase domain-containing protein n=1 Tax=Microtetraspora fusca TaxID=1997 RepID=A0ABW6VAF7_MICFU|nr:serine hydrolase domain-containing protein [Microtetraspora fusca]